MASQHFSGTVRSTKDTLRFGPLSLKRVETVPTSIEGRNGDLVLVDDTADASEDVAVNRIPTTARLYQKLPILVTPGNFTITTTSGVFTITIASLDDFVTEVNRANIPGVTLTHGPRGNVTINTISSTWADGTSNLPSVLGINGSQVGNFVVGFGNWDSFPLGSSVAQVNVINGQIIITYADTFRGKTLSSALTTIDLSRVTVASLDWIHGDSELGWIMPLDGTLVFSTYHNINDNGNTQDLDFYINGVFVTTLFTTPGSGAENSDVDSTLNIDFDQGDKLQVRAGLSAGQIEDTQVTLWVRWRA